MGEGNLAYSDTRIDYDKMADVLYISFGAPKAAISDEVDDGDFVRVDPFTDEIVGITLLDFKERYLIENIEESAQLIIPEILDKFRKHSHQILRKIGLGSLQPAF